MENGQILEQNQRTDCNTAELNIHSNEYDEVASQQENSLENNAKMKRVINRDNGNCHNRDNGNCHNRDNGNCHNRDNGNGKGKYNWRKHTRRKKLTDEEKRAKFEARQQKKVELAKMSKMDRQAYKEKMKEERIERKNRKIVEKMEKMTDKQIAKLREKLKLIEEKRERLNNETVEEKVAYKKNKREEAKKRRQRFAYLAENWTDEFDIKVDHLIVDGNNLRGGGPRRKSRDDIVKRTAQVVANCEHLKDTHVICMFDRHIASYEEVEGIDVQFSGDVIADDIIVKLAKDYEGVVVVITCDRGLALRILDMNDNLSEQKRYKVMRNKCFKSYLE